MMSTEAWLYGSVARDAADSTSDLDVLLVAPEMEISVPSQVERAVASLPNRQHLSVVTYDWRSVEQMIAYGSLFMLHVKMEGRPLWCEGEKSVLVHLLEALGPYKSAERDIEGFYLALSDVANSLEEGGDPAFELSVIATVIRHCSILACYLIGSPVFDRNASIGNAFSAVQMESFAKGALNVYQFRLAQARKIPVRDLPSKMAALRWCAIAMEFVRRTGGLCGR